MEKLSISEVISIKPHGREGGWGGGGVEDGAFRVKNESTTVHVPEHKEKSSGTILGAELKLIKHKLGPTQLNSFFRS